MSAGARRAQPGAYARITLRHNRERVAVTGRVAADETSETDDESPEQDTMFVVLTVPSDYIDDLETMGAGAHAVLGPAMTSTAPQITQAVADAIGSALV